MHLGLFHYLHLRKLSRQYFAVTIPVSDRVDQDTLCHVFKAFKDLNGKEKVDCLQI